MKIGITLPQFRADPQLAIDTARRAEELGLDGAFVFDHLWPLGHPERPALHCYELLAALAVETDRLTIGPLVARIGLYPNAVLINTMASIHRLVGDRLIVALGVGDRLSKAENEAFGVAFSPAAERLGALRRCVAAMRQREMTTWVGGLSPETRAIAVAEADALNVWGAPIERVAAETEVPVTWGGQVDVGTDDVAALVANLAAAGATWAVLAPVGAEWPEAVEAIAAARRHLAVDPT